MAFPSQAQPATHVGSASLLRDTTSAPQAQAATHVGSAARVRDGAGVAQAGPATHLGTGDPFKFLTGVSQAQPATLVGQLDVIHNSTGVPAQPQPATLVGQLDVIHNSLPEENLLELSGIVQAGPATHFGTAERITTGFGVPQAGPATHIQGPHHDTIHIGVGVPQAGPAEHPSTIGFVGYLNDNGIPGIQAGGVAQAGPATAYGPLWQRPLHMQGVVFPQAAPEACPAEPAQPPEAVINFPESGVVFGPLQDKNCRSDIDPIKRMVVEGCYHLAVDKSIKVSFAFIRTFTEPGPYTIELYRGRAVNDDRWEKIAQVTDQSWIFDKRPSPRPHERATYYRLRITDGNGISYWCHPTSFDTVWNRHDWRIVKEIVRKELLIQGRHKNPRRARGAGTKGWLLKRRQFGDPCPDCLDPNTGAVTNANCGTCFGTGVEGGYYEALEYWVLQEPAVRSTRLSDAGETRTTVMERVRGLAHPSPEAQDIWVSAAGDVRYEVQGDIEKLARHRGVEIILGLRLLELPTTHAAYSIPIEEMCRV